MCSTPAEMGLSYRHCGVPEDWIFVARALARQRRATATRSPRAWREIQAAREATQPIRARTGGSTFANPPGHKAWELIDAAGCRGLRAAARMVSEQHANFLINTGDATAADIEGAGRGGAPPRPRQSGIDARMGNPPHRPRLRAARGAP